MGNPNPVQNEALKAKQFKPLVGEPMGKVVGTRYPISVTEKLEAMDTGDRSQFIRDAVQEKLVREGLL